MSKQNILYISIAALALLVVGRILGASIGGILYAIGGLAALAVWIIGLIKTAQLKRWGWFVAVLLFTPLSTLIYGINGPEAKRG